MKRHPEVYCPGLGLDRNLVDKAVPRFDACGEGDSMLKLYRRAIQNIVILVVRPYVIRELPGWGKLAFLFDYRRDWLWIDAPVKTIREKIYGNLVLLDRST